MNRASFPEFWVKLLDTETGEQRIVDAEYDNEFIWAEGNYSCDCNRRLFFERSKGNEPDDVECGESRYVIVGTNITGLKSEG